MRRALHTALPVNTPLCALVVGLLLVLLPLLPSLPGDTPLAGIALAAGAALAAVVLAGALLVVPAAPCGPRPPLIGEERRLRGALRRQTNPDTPGCPRRPRAPGRTATA